MTEQVAKSRNHGAEPRSGTATGDFHDRHRRHAHKQTPLPPAASTGLVEPLADYPILTEVLFAELMQDHARVALHVRDQPVIRDLNRHIAKSRDALQAQFAILVKYVTTYRRKRGLLAASMPPAKTSPAGWWEPRVVSEQQWAKDTMKALTGVGYDKRMDQLSDTVGEAFRQAATVLGEDGRGDRFVEVRHKRNVMRYYVVSDAPGNG